MASDETPGYRVRQDGWTAQRQRMFLRALGETGSVRDACARAQISTTSAYRHRQRSDVFDRAWRRALGKVGPTIEQAAFERAVLGWEEPVWHAGKLVGYRRRYSDNLLRLLLVRGVRAAEEPQEPPLRGQVHRATQAETDAELLKRLRAFKQKLEAEKARALPPPAAAGTTPGLIESGERHAGDDDRGAAHPVRDGDYPRIWGPSARTL
jgi:AcrR family transcriptional regulator